MGQREFDEAQVLTLEDLLPTRENLAPVRESQVEPKLLASVVVGRVVGVAKTGEVLVEHSRGCAPAVARLACNATAAELHDREVTLLFEDADFNKPIITGVLRDKPHAPSDVIKIDAEQLVLNAGREIEIRCGKATIRLTKDGKVVLQGTYLNSTSKGVNRIRGGSVKIN